MTSVNEADLEETTSNRGSPAEAPTMIEEAISALRGAHEDIDHISTILSDEGAIVEAFFEVYRELAQPLAEVPVNRSVLPGELGEVERAHLTPDGWLVINRTDGETESLDLSEGENRDLLVSVIGDIVPRLRGLSGGTLELDEPMVHPEAELFDREPIVEPVVIDGAVEAEEPIIEELLTGEELDDEPIEVEEPPVVGEPFIEEPLTGEEMDGEPIEDEEPPVLVEPIDEDEEPRLEKAVVREPVVPRETVPEDQEAEGLDYERERLPGRTRRTGDDQIMKLRESVGRQREDTLRQMAYIERLRDARVQRMRDAKNKEREADQRHTRGFLRRVRGILDRMRGR